MIDYSYQIGPIIAIDVRPRPVDKTMVCCPDAKCERHWKSTDDNFCRICGREIMEHHYEETEYVSWYDFERSLWNEDPALDKEREIEDVFICPEYVGTEERIILLSNMTAHNRYLDENDFVLLSQFESSSAMRKFKSDNAEWIKLIEEFFGVGNVTIEVAAVSYTS